MQSANFSFSTNEALQPLRHPWIHDQLFQGRERVTKNISKKISQLFCLVRSGHCKQWSSQMLKRCATSFALYEILRFVFSLVAIRLVYGNFVINHIFVKRKINAQWIAVLWQVWATIYSYCHSPPHNTSLPPLPEPPHSVSECSELCYGQYCDTSQTDSITDKSGSFSFNSPDNAT